MSESPTGVDSDETVWKSNPELQSKLKESPYYVEKELATVVLAEFLKSGGFDNPNLKIPKVSELPRAFMVNSYVSEGISFCIKKEVEEPWHTAEDCLIGDEIFAGENIPDHVAPTTIVGKNGDKYVVQKLVDGKRLGSLPKVEIPVVVDDMAAHGIYMPDYLDNVIVIDGGKWVVVDTAFVMNREQHDKLVASQKDDEHDGFFDEWKDRQ